MPKEDVIEITGKIIEVLPNATFRVELETKRIIMAHLAGKMRLRHIKVVAGDIVKVELSTYDLTRGRITYRMKHEAA